MAVRSVFEMVEEANAGLDNCIPGAHHTRAACVRCLPPRSFRTWGVDNVSHIEAGFAGWRDETTEDDETWKTNRST